MLPLRIHRAERSRILARYAALPLLAAVFLAAGAAAHLFAQGRGDALGARIWLFGLLLTGTPIVVETALQAARGRFATDLVAMLAIVGAVLTNEPLAGLVIVLMRSGGQALDRYAEGRASRAVRDLEAASPHTAHRLNGDRLEDVAAEAVRPGDLLLVRPGELIPCDATVVSGRSTVDASRLTGEPLPIEAVVGTTLLSGSANGRAPLTVRADAEASASAYARIVELVRSAQATKAPIQRTADRYAVWFTPLTLLVCAATWLWQGDPSRVLAVLVVATPCPLILATPIAIIGGINRAARRQIVVRTGGALERIGALDAVVFDKTGTLTVGRPEVARIVALSGWKESEVLRLAAAIEQSAGHLLARSVVDAAHRTVDGGRGALPLALDASESPGRGITGLVEGRRVTVGSPPYVLEQEDRCDESTLAAVPASEASVRAYVAVDGALAGVIEFADRVRDDAAGVLRDLAALDIRRVLLLSGDTTPNVTSVASALGLSDARGDLLPEEKVDVIRELIRGGDRVLMVGDGTNDAPAMSSATVSIALAAHGGGITAEAADIVILADDLSRVPEAIRIGRRTVRIARQSIVAGIGLSVVAMAAAALGAFPAAVGALVQEVIDVAVILNALRASR